jgi:hypothetical protein
MRKQLHAGTLLCTDWSDFDFDFDYDFDFDRGWHWQLVASVAQQQEELKPSNPIQIPSYTLTYRALDNTINDTLGGTPWVSY